MSGSTGVSVSTNGNTTTYTASNGTTYAITQNPGFLGGPSANSNVVITYPPGSGLPTLNFNGNWFGLPTIPNSNIISINNNPLKILTVGNNYYIILPGVSTSVNIIASLVGTDTFYVGGTAVINSGIAIGSGMTLNVDGGTATATSGSIVGAFSGVKVNLTDGGTFSNGDGLLNVLSGSTINFGSGGGTFIVNAGGDFLDLSSISINNFDSTKSNIEFQGLKSPLLAYKISTASTGLLTGNVTSQLIQLYGANSTLIGKVVVQGNNFINGFYPVGTGPLAYSQTGGSTVINVDPPQGSTPCFLAQTMIATPEGEKAMVELAVGDLVLSQDGVAMPIRWIGHRKVSTLFADPLRSLPIRIQAGVLGDGLPKRDLLISPDHALLIDGILANAGALVNGQTITREEMQDEVFTYYHIEVDDHALILAEGVPAETFIDHVERMAFDNWAEHMEVFGEVCDKPEMEYPRAKSARQLPQSLKERLGHKHAA